MSRSYLYSFEPSIAWDDIESSLLLALWATEGLHGLSRMHLEAEFSVDPPARTCTITASTKAGSDLNRIFTSFLLRELGEEAFKVQCHTMRAAA